MQDRYRLALFLINAYSTISVFLSHLVSLEGLLSVSLSVAMTVFLFETTGDTAFDGVGLNWVLLSFAVVTPISASVRMAFQRRENALQSIGNLRATALKLYASHAAWDFKFDRTDSSEQVSTHKLKHSDQVLGVILHLLALITRYLTLPTNTRARHKLTRSGQLEAKELSRVSSKLLHEMMVDMAKLTEFCELLKQEGLPPQEAIRIRQWERFLLIETESLGMIKSYRTPQGLRSFGRLFSMILPPFYAPQYVHTARDQNSVGVGVALACFTSFALTSLFETVSQMEDPFVIRSGLDGVRVHSELISNFLSRALRSRKDFFPYSPPYERDENRFLESHGAHPHMLIARILDE